jgi:hypothetical protein
MKQISLLITALFAFIAIGCSTVDQGQSSVVVRSEQTQQIAFDVLDRYVNWEYENRALLAAISPEFKIAGDRIRSKGLDAIEALHRVTKKYKDNRTPENLADLQTWLAVVQGLQAEAVTLIAKGTL